MINLEQFNTASRDEAISHLVNCNAARSWGEQLADARPMASLSSLKDVASKIWASLGEGDYLEAFDGHPQIGDPDSLKQKYAATLSLASNEQSSVTQASDAVIQDLALQNKQYHDKFGFIFIVCATGKSAGQMLELIKQRLPNTRAQELLNAAEEQRKITEIRLTNLFG